MKAETELQKKLNENMEQICCEPFKSLVGRFDWFEEPVSGVFLMPYIQADDNKWRVNYCPVCGANIRSIQIPADQFHPLISLP